MVCQGLEVITSGLAHNTILQIFIVEKAGVSDDGVSGFCRVLYDHATGLASSELGVPVSGLRYVAFGCEFPSLPSLLLRHTWIVVCLTNGSLWLLTTHSYVFQPIKLGTLRRKALRK